MRGTYIIKILVLLSSLRPANAAFVEVTKRIAYFNLVRRFLLPLTMAYSLPRMFLSSWENISYIVLHGNDSVYLNNFQFFDKGCHNLCPNVICKLRHVFRLTIYKFHCKYIWRLVRFTESDARRTQKAALRTEKNRIEYRGAVFLRGSYFYQPKHSISPLAERRREEKEVEKRNSDMSLKFKLHDCRRAHNNAARTFIHLV